MKKALIVVAAVVVLGGIGVAFWAESILATDTVREAVARQIGDAIGQPVAIGGIGAGIFPRVTMRLDNVRIGEPSRIDVGTVRVGTDLGALLSRRIEHATLNVSDARIQLPLPPLTIGTPSGPAPQGEPEGTGPPVELVSIDEIHMEDIEISSGGRTLRGDVDIAPRSDGGLDVRNMALEADGTTITVTGAITDLSRPAGELALTAGALDFEGLMGFLADFVASAPSDRQSPSATPARPSVPGQVDIAMTIDADRASFGDLTLDDVSARARLTPAGLLLNPLTFGVFDGRYEGSLALSLADPPVFDLNARLTGVDVGSVMAFAEAPGLMTGRFAGALALKGRGLSADTALNTAAGTARVEIADGVVKGLGLVRGVVLATAMRDDSRAALNTTTVDEPFSSLTATLQVANGAARTDDLRFESKDLTLTVAGTVRLDGSAIDMRGQVQLSEELSAQAGRDLQRVASEQGRVTLPVTIGGSAEDPQVRIDVAGAARRAITDRANEEAQKAIERNLPGILRRR